MCEACKFGKQVSSSLENKTIRSRYALELIHTYVWEPTKEVSIGGNRHYVTFIDDFTRKVWM